MKHDPKFSAPEFWVLKNTGSFSFEFMGGGTAVVCGVDCENAPSVLGSRSCVGMVGGTVYVRGNVCDLSEDVYIVELNDADRDFLRKGIPEFLENVERFDLIERLCDFSQWKKIVAKTYEERKANHLIPIKDFRENSWVKGGIFRMFMKMILKWRRLSAEASTDCVIRAGTTTQTPLRAKTTAPSVFQRKKESI